MCFPQIAAKIQPAGQKRPLEETESGMDRVPGGCYSSGGVDGVLVVVEVIVMVCTDGNPLTSQACCSQVPTPSGPQVVAAAVVQTQVAGDPVDQVLGGLAEGPGEEGSQRLWEDL